MKRALLSTLVLSLLAACGPAAATPTPEVPPLRQPYAPRPGDSALLRGKVYLESTDLLIMESFPIQVALNLKGSLPTPCHQLRAQVSDPDAGNRIAVEVYSLSDPGEVCIQVLEPFEASLPLGSFPAGHYTLTVNGEQVGEFDA
jgi:hypothetical protein